MPPTERRPATEAEAKAVASAFRLRILRLCLDQPLTNKQIADALDVNPATVLHHVRTLVKTGFLAAQPPRRGPHGAREIPYLSTRKTWTLHFPGRGQEMVDAFLGEYARVQDPGEVKMSRLGLRLNEQEYAELERRITDLFEELAARPSDPTGRAYSLFYALLPDVDRATGADGTASFSTRAPG